jgi:hypothetical protein
LEIPGVFPAFKKGGVKDLLVEVFGLAARDPQQYCKVVKQKMKAYPLAMKMFDLVAHQWALGQFEMQCSIPPKMQRAWGNTTWLRPISLNT